MTPHIPTTTSSTSTPVGPLLLFLALCLLFQVPSLTKATDATSIITSSAHSLQEPQLDEAALLPRSAAPAPQPDWTTAPTSWLQPQVIVQTQYTTVCPNCAPSTTPWQSISTQYISVTTATCTIPNTPTSTTTTTVTSLSSKSTTPNQVTTTTTTVRGFITTNGGYGAVGGGQYCSTLYAQGGGLPTTRLGNCGTILVEEPSGASSVKSEKKGSMLGLVLGVGVLFLLGAVG